MDKLFKRILLGVLMLTGAFIVVKKLFLKKQKPSDFETADGASKQLGMRVIENPFEEKIVAKQNGLDEVVVVNNGFNWYEVYKRDILSAIVIFSVIAAIIVVSLYAYKFRVGKDNASMLEAAKVDSIMLHSLDEIKFSLGVISERVDSLNENVLNGTRAMSEMTILFENSNNKKGTKQ